MPDNETAREVCLDYTMAAARGITQKAKARKEAAQGEYGRFRFVYLSGAAAEKDQERALWFKGDYRRIRVRYLLFSPTTSFAGALSFTFRVMKRVGFAETNPRQGTGRK